jgi:hypothetical protein
MENLQPFHGSWQAQFEMVPGAGGSTLLFTRLKASYLATSLILIKFIEHKVVISNILTSGISHNPTDTAL